MAFLTPDAFAQRLADVDIGMFERWGVRGLVVDLDNTLVPWNSREVTPDGDAWLRSVQKAGIKVCLLTNNYSSAARAIADDFGVSSIAGALKPSPWAFRGALRALGVTAKQAAVVGDQIFTDVLGGKLVGMRAVLVRPLGAAEFPTTKVIRLLERPLLERLRRSGHVT
ncbi:MAG TPA: YqeG family HAD IIIA-type phosphatase [Candidatus Eremiobacteraceae bacterium]|nr:YqeG family HAD IIIA-type phosphatase [Candidatus Eremiobacteraceae bacterium]